MSSTTDVFAIVWRPCSANKKKSPQREWLGLNEEQQAECQTGVGASWIVARLLTAIWLLPFRQRSKDEL